MGTFVNMNTRRERLTEMAGDNPKGETQWVNY